MGRVWVSMFVNEGPIGLATSLTAFLEEVMKWAYLKYPNLCLPEAAA